MGRAQNIQLLEVMKTLGDGMQGSVIGVTQDGQKELAELRAALGQNRNDPGRFHVTRTQEEKSTAVGELCLPREHCPRARRQ